MTKKRKILGVCASETSEPGDTGGPMIRVGRSARGDEDAPIGLNCVYPTLLPSPGEEVVEICVRRHVHPNGYVVASAWAAEAIEALDAARFVVRKGTPGRTVPDGEVWLSGHRYRCDQFHTIGFPGTEWGKYRICMLTAENVKQEIERWRAIRVSGEKADAPAGDVPAPTSVQQAAIQQEAPLAHKQRCPRCGGHAYVGLLKVECERVGGCQTLDERMGEPSVQSTSFGHGEVYYIAYGEHEESLGEAARKDEVGTHPTRDGAIEAWRAKMRTKLIKEDAS